ncbi:cytochrome P450 [Streptomyces cupreus]|uniref:Cytochrome P450 n=1 Tax=Streptomyces cupreus TaxID=2759956 RepID=A0A7X1J635_9ACTN|nr:cytochrome P450 [Streptomyces cupreus]MBC2904369.1 cytochrome P450 [Streptomyces cupreus]
MTLPPHDRPAPPECPAHAGRVRLSSDTMLGELAGLYEKWRAEHGPVVPIELDGVEAHLVIGHRALLGVCRQEGIFTPDSREWSALREGRVPADWPWLPQVAYAEGNARFTTGPEHRRLRGLLSSGINQADGAFVRRFVTWVADRLIDRFAATGRADIVSEYAAPLPMLVMLRLLGLPHETGEALLPAIFRLLEGGAEARSANEEINSILGRLVDERRVKPERDLVSWLIHGPVTDGPALSDLEVRNLAWLTVMAGAGGTTGWMANVMEQLVRGADLHALYLAGKASVAEIMNETHRSNPAVQNVLGRFPVRDIPEGELGNQHPIPRGALVVLGLAGANADPDATGGEEQGAHLANEYHYAFGAGPHECPTAAQKLAHIIAQAAVERLLVRCRNLRLEDEDAVQWGGSVIVRQLSSLRIAFASGGQPADGDAEFSSALGDASRSSHALFPPRMLTQLTARMAQ